MTVVWVPATNGAPFSVAVDPSTVTVNALAGAVVEDSASMKRRAIWVPSAEVDANSSVGRTPSTRRSASIPTSSAV